MKGVGKGAAGRASPGMRYKNVDAAIAFLCRAFGCELRSSETDQNGHVIYAELSFGSTIIMIGAVSGFDMDRFMAQPADIGGAETQCCYYVVDDLDAQYARARDAGCEIVIDMQTRPNGARAFTCRDLEGHLWCFGTYDPWQSLSIAPDGSDPVPETEALVDDEHAAAQRKVPKFPARLAAGLSMGAVVTSLVAAWVYGEAWQTSREATAAPTAIGPERLISLELGKETFQSAIKDARRRLAIERRIRRAAERASKAAQAEAAQERSQRVTAEETAKKLAEQLARAQQAAELAQRAASTAQGNLEKERAAAKERTASDQAERKRLTREVELAQRAAADARAELERAKQAQAAAEKEAKATRARLTFISHSATESSQQAIAHVRKRLQDETAAREAAERLVKTARADLARERDLKAAAWRTVRRLKRRLAAAGISTGQSQYKKAKYKKAKAKAAAANAAPTPTTQKGWSLYGGPVFFKDAGAP